MTDSMRGVTSDVRGADAGDITEVNHVGIAVHDMDAAARVFESLGFLLTPLSAHKGALSPEASVAPLGSANRCAVFANDYLEVLTHADASRPDPRQTRFLSRHEGAHIICHATNDTEATDRRWRASGIPTSGVIPLQRDVDTPEGVRTARFERVQIDAADAPEGLMQAARHLTPDYIHQARYCAHPNGVTGIAETLIVADDPAECIARHARYAGRTVIRDGVRHSIALRGPSRLSVIATVDAEALLGESCAGTPPRIAAVSLRTDRLRSLRQRFLAGAIAHAERDGRLIVPSQFACGVVLMFEAT
jgi:hypothetical protein